MASGVGSFAKETIHLKNGSIIKGDIIEEVPGVSLKIKTGEGNIFVYEMSDIARVERNVISETKGGCNNRHNKLDFSIGTGYNVATKGGGGNIPVELTVSKRFSPYYSVGITSGIEIGTGSDAKPLIPILADFRGFLPLNTTSVTPMVDVRIGYAINTAESYTVGSGKYKTTVDMPNYVVFSIMPGVRLPINHRCDLDFGLGYEHYAANGGGSGAFAMRVGLNFHASTDPNREKKPKRVNPIWNSGLEIGVEGNGIGEQGASILLGYKLSPKWSFAFGVGASHQSYDIHGGVSTLYSKKDYNGEILGTYENEHHTDHESAISLKVFVRGQYRFLDKKFSPIASVDLGYNHPLYDGEYYTDPIGYSLDMDDLTAEPKCFFVRPAVGASMRIGSNSYLELKAGYCISSGIPAKKMEINEPGYIYDGSYKMYYKSKIVERKGVDLSSFYVGLSYKHTFSLFSRH